METLTNKMLVLFVVYLLNMTLVVGEKLDHLSFEPPFSEVDYSGSRFSPIRNFNICSHLIHSFWSRMINRDWRISGSTTVQTNFARLTPDQQSKKGAVWSRKSLGVPSFSVILKFRISGKGKVFFGDGIGFWIVQQGYYTDGDLHGCPEKFTGIGIIFDTFKNTEHLSAHRDVTLLVNDGEKTYEMMTAEVQGCNANFRYHSERADFVVTDATRAKIVVEDTNITISIDPKNTGDWTDCVTLKDVKLPSEWARRAHIGITGTTGQLSDNHDVISLQTFSDFQVMEAHDAIQATKKKFESNPEDTVRNRLQRVEEAINEIFEKLDFQDHHVEHELVTLGEHVSHLHSQVDSLQGTTPSSETSESKGREKGVDETSAVIEKKLEQKFKEQMEAFSLSLEKKLVATASSSWRFPFLILFLVMSGSGIGLYFFYQRLRKMHML